MCFITRKRKQSEFWSMVCIVLLRFLASYILLIRNPRVSCIEISTHVSISIKPKQKSYPFHNCYGSRSGQHLAFVLHVYWLTNELFIKLKIVELKCDRLQTFSLFLSFITSIFPLNLYACRSCLYNCHRIRKVPSFLPHECFVFKFSI